MAAHARLGPSDSARWLACPGAINFTRDYPRESTGAADEGTAAHWVREQCLSLGFDAYDFIGTEISVNGVIYPCDDEMADALQPGIDEIREFNGKLFVEERIDLGRWMPGQFGTLDCGVAGEHLIVISDLKFGRGVAVDAVGNTQQMIYALGFWDQIARHVTDATQFLIIIDQPRHGAGGGYWYRTLDELLAFGEELRVKAQATADPAAPLVPGDKQCTWCPAANVPGRPGGCPAHARAQMDKLELEFDDLDVCGDLGTIWQPPAVETLSHERLIQLSLAKKGIEQFLEYAHARAIQHLVDHGPACGQKAVYGRKPPRKWANEKGAQGFMLQKGVEPFNKKMKTVAQAESEVGKKYEIPKALVEQGQPKPVMVDVSDARPAIVTVENEFDDVEDL